MKTALLVCLLAGALTACGSTKVLEEPVPVEISRPLAVAADQRLAASLDWIIYRNGPGTWASPVDWDEYLMRVQNLSAETIHLTDVVVYDSLGTPIELRGSHRGLIAGTKLVADRYEDEGIDVRAGLGGEALLAAGGVVGLTSYGATLSLLALGEMTGITTTATLGTAMAGLFVVTPALIVGGIERNKNNRAIAREIGARQTPLPVMLAPGDGRNLDLFFPVSPSPVNIEVTYVDVDGEHNLIIDTRQVLEGLHLGEAE